MDLERNQYLNLVLIIKNNKSKVYLTLELELDPLVNEQLQTFEYSGDLKVFDNAVRVSIHPAYKKKKC